ncbi:ubiquinone/menaquinone biosynthesis methyltransferase ubiE [Phenylobacterium zucineum HLK1]|uniref:Ubiquinone/menaquinone biosynthesis methyltransferase ubiE n=1 Tax=Phenylobacterium zucineum (strain HLK1) TaxID=450851 RepID=B4R994_PHEZH|nr:class I SAM-dependent methyltransferase [Phenylobacterium zucineum]ACG77764.1 ubiquinone/menaquinone biosynthesis methyltransferase ubiE [Phenylobacterium zucineum HLK1]
MSATAAPNRDQAVLWNEANGRTWVELQSVLDRMLAPFASIVVDEAFPGAGGRVTDIGCGAGATTLAMARRLGPGGLALGVDISGPLVAAAAERARAERLENAAFVQADAQTYAFDEAGFDAVMSRFGVMFFEDPEAAFANIRRGVRSGGKLAFVAWRSPAENPFMTTAMRAAAPFLPPLPTPEPGAPGQFGFADGERVRRILEASGWTGVEVRPIDVPASVAEADLKTYVARMGPVGAAMRELPEADRARIVEALQTAYAPFIEDGEARFTAACWLVTARA